jgi:plasmid replication initiation protein
MVAIELTLSRWFFNAICAREVLTISSDYFRLRRPLERRIYEIARKHCGRQDSWKVSLGVLYKKTGSTSPMKEFRRLIKRLHSSNHLPDYEVEFLSDEDSLLFRSRQGVLNLVEKGEVRT